MKRRITSDGLSRARNRVSRRGSLLTRGLLLTLWFALPFAITDASGQQLAKSGTGAGQTGGGAQDEDEEFIFPERPSEADTAEFQRPGVLQLEYGYDANFRGDEERAEQVLPLRLRFAVTTLFLIDAEIETIHSVTSEETRRRETGIGETRIGFQVLPVKQRGGRPAIGFGYRAKLPTASREKQLGSGRIDHRFALLLDKKFGDVEIDLNAALLVNGREGAGGYVTGGQGALAVQRRFENRFGVIGEISGQTKEERSPRGLYALGGVTYKVNRRLQFDAGVRVGLTPGSPRVGFTGGFTLGVADLYRRR